MAKKRVTKPKTTKPTRVEPPFDNGVKTPYPDTRPPEQKGQNGVTPR